MNSPKYYIFTYGCQMNKNDSERMSQILEDLDFVSTEVAEEADIILINTCSVRQSAEDRVYGRVRNFAKIKKNNPDLIIGITGCMPGRDEKKKFKAKMPAVDLYFPTDQMSQLPTWISQLRPDLLHQPEVCEDYLKVQPKQTYKYKAYVTIQTGCNKYCSYCVVPYARGFEKNRPLTDILGEIKQLVKDGCLEVTLLGQTINSYVAPDKESFSADNPFADHFAALLWEINQIDGLRRLHYTAPHPIHMNDETIEAMALPKHVNFIHLPVQSGNDEVLKKMNRRYTREEYLDLIKRIYKRLPNIAIGTDIIVGFSGETDADFQDTVDLYKQSDFDISYTAIYSERSGTLADKVFDDDVPRSEKKKRWKILQDLMKEIVYRKNQKFVGQTVSVLVDEFDPVKKVCRGQSGEIKLVQFSGSKDLIGTIVDVKVTEAKEWVLIGALNS